MVHCKCILYVRVVCFKALSPLVLGVSNFEKKKKKTRPQKYVKIGYNRCEDNTYTRPNILVAHGI